MIKMKKVIAVGTTVLVMGAMSVSAFAASGNKTPAEVVAGLTEKSVDQVTDERYETGKTYGTIAAESGTLDEFKEEMLQIKKDDLAQSVADGTITQERADEILKALEDNSAICDGTGSAKIGQQYGAGFGNGRGTGCGTGKVSRNGK